MTAVQHRGVTDEQGVECYSLQKCVVYIVVYPDGHLFVGGCKNR